MNKFRIVIRHLINDEIISDNLIINNLSKMDYSDLDIIVAIIFEELHYNNELIGLCGCIGDIRGIDIFYRHECGHDELLLSVKDLDILEAIHRGVDIAHERCLDICTWLNKNIKEEILTKNRKYDLEQTARKFKYYELEGDVLTFPKACIKKK
jgi:hypothetical protein